MKHFLSSLALMLAMLISGTSRAQSGCELTQWILEQPAHSTRTPELPPETHDTTIVVNGTAHHIALPEGFALSVFASVRTARGLAVSPDGVLYCTTMESEGRVWRLPDHNHDGVPDSTIQVWKDTRKVHGIRFLNGDLYISSDAQLLKLIDDDHNGIYEKSKTIATFPGGGHNTRSFVIDTINKRFLVQVGSSGNVTKELPQDSIRATVLSMNYDGSNVRIFSRGLRNTVGMDLDPRTNALWANNNGMDDLYGSTNPKHNEIPPESIYLLCDGAHYGWPYAWGFRMRNPMSGYQVDTSIIQSYNGPVAEILAHSAPLGLHFYRGSKLPAKYHNAIFQCYHGSWDRVVPAPSRVTVMFADADGRNARVQDFITGFQPDSNYNNRWGRPVSIVEGSEQFGDSSLYISDDAQSVIYRLTYGGAAPEKSVKQAVAQDLRIVSVVPNPLTNRATVSIEGSDNGQSIRVELLDILGRAQRFAMTSHQLSNRTTIDIERGELTSGQYLLRVSSGGRFISTWVRFVD